MIGDLRAIRADLPVVLMSGDHERYGRGPAEAPDFVRLAKPFSVKEFSTALRQALGESKNLPPR